ncbi:MAG: DMT family transporter [Thaumarchaeota archaeon]|nr:DMT family transporter [Nitrososphaerota archaeon]MDE1840378.1 DMT family transporter [Nitrososphaerota archaeon]MDE1878201.1 DMT family transporter [Nitrososphaerota archaeon]
MNKTAVAGYMSALVASAFFGAVPTIAKPMTSSINVLLLSSIAYLIAALTFTPMAKKAKTTLVKKDYAILVAISVCGAAAAPCLYFLGLRQSSAADTSLLSNVEIMFTVLFGLVFFKERLRPIGFIAVAMVVLGVIVITTDLRFSGSFLQLNAGHFFILGAMALWALDNNLSRIISTKMDTARLVQLKSVIGGLILLGAVFLLGIPLDMNTSQVPYVILLSAIGFGGSLYFFLQSLKRIGTIRTIVIFSTSSVFGLVFASAFLHEPISLYQTAAIAVMLAGVYLVNRKESVKEKIEPSRV